MSLKQTYDNFANYLEHNKQNAITDAINEPAERLNIYRNNVLASKIDSITASYPAIAAIVGPKFFRNFAAIYAKEKPSCSGNLDDYAQDFPEFVKANHKLHQLDYLYDLALFELNTNLIDQHSGFLKTLNLEQQSDEALMQSRLKLKENCLIQSANFPILSLFLFSKNRLDTTPNLSKAETVLIYKDKYDIRFLELDATETNFLRTFNGQTSLYDCFCQFDTSDQFSNLLNKFHLHLTMGLSQI